MPKFITAHLVAGLLSFLALFQHPLLARSPECPTQEHLLSASDPAYADAMELVQKLENHGFIIRCMFPTKFGSIFRVVEDGVERSTIEGEADFRTNYGDFDVVFVPRPQTFADFNITEQREPKGYLYKFAGLPRVWAVNRMETVRREHFLKHENQLLLVGDDAKLRTRLEQALDLSPRTP